MMTQSSSPVLRLLVHKDWTFKTSLPPQIFFVNWISLQPHLLGVCKTTTSMTLPRLFLSLLLQHGLSTWSFINLQPVDPPSLSYITKVVRVEVPGRGMRCWEAVTARRKVSALELKMPWAHII